MQHASVDAGPQVEGEEGCEDGETEPTIEEINQRLRDQGYSEVGPRSQQIPHKLSTVFCFPKPDYCRCLHQHQAE